MKEAPAKQKRLPLNFIAKLVEATAKNGHKPILRFPPEPNGYLHLGHAKSLVLNFGLARAWKGLCHLRFDDSNPEGENKLFIEAIKEDIRWLGFQWDRECYASDYFPTLYRLACQLIEQKDAYVCELSSEEIQKGRGEVKIPGVASPFRGRDTQENLKLFEKMKNGEIPEGSLTLRAKIDMAHPNLILRDPVLYRVKHTPHHRSGKTWRAYPTYDFVHGQSDSIEKITHSLCTLEFKDHRELYNWLIQKLDIFPSRQYEFARLNLTHTLMSKRKTAKLIENKWVDGWDDPRLPTLRGLRRRGCPPQAILKFCEAIGVTRYPSINELSLFEHFIRAELQNEVPRYLGVLKPLKVTLKNIAAEQIENLQGPLYPARADSPTRSLPLTRTIYIEQEDFKQHPHKNFFRLTEGGQARLRHSYLIKCIKTIKGTNGETQELLATVNKNSLGKNPNGEKVKGVLHWVSANKSVPLPTQLYDTLFKEPFPEEQKHLESTLNPNSKKLTQIFVEPALAQHLKQHLNKQTPQKFRFQLERLAYFCADSNCQANKPTLNRIVSLKANKNKPPSPTNHPHPHA